MIVNKLTATQKEQLKHVPSVRYHSLEYWPCKVITTDGKTYDNVYLTDVGEYRFYWDLLPDEDASKQYVLIEDVKEIYDSPNRIPPAMAEKLYDAGETITGFSLFTVFFENNTSLEVLAGTVVDFIPMPEGLSTQNIIDILPHKGKRTDYVIAPTYHWCLYKK